MGKKINIRIRNARREMFDNLEEEAMYKKGRRSRKPFLEENEPPKTQKRRDMRDD
jgi:hypothetical protein